MGARDFFFACFFVSFLLISFTFCVRFLLIFFTCFGTVARGDLRVCQAARCDFRHFSHVFPQFSLTFPPHFSHFPLTSPLSLLTFPSLFSHDAHLFTPENECAGDGAHSFPPRFPHLLTASSHYYIIIMYYNVLLCYYNYILLCYYIMLF